MRKYYCPCCQRLLDEMHMYVMQQTLHVQTIDGKERLLMEDGEVDTYCPECDARFEHTVPDDLIVEVSEDGAITPIGEIVRDELADPDETR